MDFSGRLVCKKNPGSAFHAKGTLQVVASKYSSCGMHQDQVSCGMTPVQNAGNLERYFAIGLAQDCLAVLLREDKIHPCASSHFRERNRHISVFEEEFRTNPIDN